MRQFNRKDFDECSSHIDTELEKPIRTSRAVTVICKDCEAVFSSSMSRAKRCPSCRLEAQRASNRKSYHKNWEARNRDGNSPGNRRTRYIPVSQRRN